MRTTESRNHGGRGKLAPLLVVLGAGLLTVGRPANAQSLTLGNPDWNITLTDYGYSDFLLDNTPGFEGREYLSGEWGPLWPTRGGSPPTSRSGSSGSSRTGSDHGSS
jgi:hypothetical protein